MRIIASHAIFPGPKKMWFVAVNCCEGNEIIMILSGFCFEGCLGSLKFGDHRQP